MSQDVRGVQRSFEVQFTSRVEVHVTSHNLVRQHIAHTSTTKREVMSMSNTWLTMITIHSSSLSSPSSPSSSVMSFCRLFILLATSLDVIVALSPPGRRIPVSSSCVSGIDIVSSCSFAGAKTKMLMMQDDFSNKQHNPIPYYSELSEDIIQRKYRELVGVRDRRGAIVSLFEASGTGAMAAAAVSFLPTLVSASELIAIDTDVGSSDNKDIDLPPIEVTPSSPDARKLFNEGRALESQGNMAAAQRLYARVTQISPRFIYGWANLANTQVAMADLGSADENYSKAIKLCETSNAESSEQGFGVKKCSDLYVLYLNRGSVRLNNGQAKDALQDLQTSSILRGRPDAVIAQNLARAKEVNGQYGQADKDYSMAISMTANEVNPFWLRSAMVKLQLGDGKGGKDLLARVENRFPDAPEVKAASATFLLLQQNDEIAARRKFLEIPNKQRLRFSDKKYLLDVITWPPVMVDGVTTLAKAVGDV